MDLDCSELSRYCIDNLPVLSYGLNVLCNRTARKYGISRMDKVIRLPSTILHHFILKERQISDALKRCPHLKVVHTATYKAGEAEPVYVDNPDTTQYKVQESSGNNAYRIADPSWLIYRSPWTIIGVRALRSPGSLGSMLGSLKLVRAFLRISSHCCLCAIAEKASIDEAFFDFSLPVKDEILRRYPHLSQPPPDSPLGQDTPLPPAPRIPFHQESVVIPPDPHAAKEKEQKASEEEKKEEEGEKSPSPPPPEPEPAPVVLTETWHDVALSIAAEMLQSMRDIVRTELGYTTSAVSRSSPLNRRGE